MQIKGNTFAFEKGLHPVDEFFDLRDDSGLCRGKMERIIFLIRFFSEGRNMR